METQKAKELDLKQIKQMEKIDGVQYSFLRAKRVTEEFTGLTLKLSELVRLRQLTKEAMQANSSAQNSINKVIVVTEAAHRFLDEFYDINITNNLWFKEFFDLDKNFNSSETIKEWFRQKQEEMFLP